MSNSKIFRTKTTHFFSKMKGCTNKQKVKDISFSEGGNVEILNYMEKIDGLTTNHMPTIKEKIGIDLYGLVAKVPRTQIGLRTKDEYRDLIVNHLMSPSQPHFKPVTPEQVENNMELYQNTDGSMSYKGIGPPNNSRYVTFCSVFLDEYRDFGPDFINYIKDNGRPPEKIINDDIPIIEVSHETEHAVIRYVDSDYPGPSYEITGVMRLAAMAMILGDRDWLGGKGFNAGFALENGRAVATMVDAGLALDDNETMRNMSSKEIKDKKIRFGNSNSIFIEFDKLTLNQKEEFLSTLHQFTRLSEEELRVCITDLVRRNGTFNQNPFNLTLLNDEDANNIVESIIANVQEIKGIYEVELAEYSNQHEEMPNNFNMPSDIFAPDYTAQSTELCHFTSIKQLREMQGNIPQEITSHMLNLINRINAEINRLKELSDEGYSTHQNESRIKILEATKHYIWSEIDFNELRQIKKGREWKSDKLDTTETFIEEAKNFCDVRLLLANLDKEIRRCEEAIKTETEGNPSTLTVLKHAKEYLGGQINKAQLEEVQSAYTDWENGSINAKDLVEQVIQYKQDVSVFEEMLGTRSSM